MKPAEPRPNGPASFDRGPTPRSLGLVGSVGRVVVLVAVLGITVGIFLPWIRTGAATRTSFEAIRTAQRLGVVDSDTASRLLGIWYFVPLLAATVVLLVVLRRDRLAGGVAIVLGLVVGVIAAVVLASSADVGGGPLVASASGVLAVVGGALVVRASRRAPRGQSGAMS